MTDGSTTSSTTGRLIQVQGASLHYEEYGDGPPVVLIHGGLVSSAMWAALVPHLTDTMRIILPDSRGHGRSTNPDGGLSYMRLADDIAGLVAALALERPVVGGWSDGGQVAVELGLRHPDVAGALVVGAAYPEFHASGLRETHRGLLAADDAGVPDIAQLEAHLGDFASVAKSWHAGGEQQWQAVVRQTAPMWLDYPGLTAADIGRIHTPTLVLAGDRDDLVPLDLSVALYRALPNAELAVCPQADHFGPLTEERASVFASVIRDFVGRHAQTR